MNLLSNECCILFIVWDLPYLVVIYFCLWESFDMFQSDQLCNELYDCLMLEPSEK